METKYVNFTALANFKQTDSPLACNIVTKWTALFIYCCRSTVSLAKNASGHFNPCLVLRDILAEFYPATCLKTLKTNLVCRRLCEFLAFPNTSPNFVVLIQPAVKYPHKDNMTLKEQQSLSSSQSIAIATCYLGIVFPRTALPVLTFAFPCFQGHAFLQWGVLSPVADANFR